MRLLDTRTGEFVLINNPEEVEYAILSHVWSRAVREQFYQDLADIQKEAQRWRESYPKWAPQPDAVLEVASGKVREACRYARCEGFHYPWIDSCYIDKSSSSELSEAISSMYNWYSHAAVCHAFLEDVGDPAGDLEASRASQWFTRAWTLQGPIAPRVVVFLFATWEMIGAKDGLAGVIEGTTGVPTAVLTRVQPLSSINVARRLSWAVRRKTTRVEDEAYTLMGISGVDVPTICGERRLAFGRLQEEILKLVPDPSLPVW
ncbi:hypothetical protein BD413DRAFT_437200, partial [Trametes elegans]